MNKLRIPLVVLIFLAVASGCRSGKDAVDPELADPCQPARREAPRILQMNFEVFENDSITMITSNFKAGKLRGRSDEEYEPKQGDLVVTFLTAGMLECESQVIANPLRRRVEFSDEYHQIRARTSALDAAIFVISTQYHNNLRFVRVEKITEDGLQQLFLMALR
jgi:hypothetical protein